MTAPDRQQSSPIKRTEQDILNNSFDEAFRVLAHMSLGYDGQNVVRQESDDLQIKIVTSGTDTYICKAAVGTDESDAKWKIFKLDADGNKIYADANANYDNVASDPTSLTYSYS